MALLDDIIDAATSKDGDVARLLRLCMVLGSRLKYAPLTEWAKGELEGYPIDRPVPAYRVFGVRNRGRFMGHYQGVWDIPLRVLPEALQPHYEKHEARDSIAEFAALVKNSTGDSTPRIPWPAELGVRYATHVRGSQCVEAWMELPPASLANVLDQVKTRVLDFALQIEEELPASRDIAEISGSIKGATVPNIFNTTILGNVQNLSQGDTGTTQVATAGIAAGDLEALISALHNVGVADQDVVSLRAAAQVSESSAGTEGRAVAVRKWLTDFTGKSVQGVATNVVSKLILGYLGS